MSEYLFVEKPLLDHLSSLGWEVIDQGCHAIPSDPAASLRDDFREATLRRVFAETVRGINLLPPAGRLTLTNRCPTDRAARRADR